MSDPDPEPGAPGTIGAPLERRDHLPTDHGPGAARARSTVRGVVLLQLLANGLGIGVVVLYLGFLFPPDASDDLAGTDVNLVAFGLYLAAMLLLALPANALLLRRAVSWVRDDRPPTERQRRLLFTLPTLETVSALISWIGAAVLFGILNTDVQRVGIGIVLAGVVVCTLLYLLLEGHFRPVYALALVDAELPEDRRDVLPRLMLPWMLGSAVPLVAIGLSPLIGPGPLDSRRLAWITGAGALAGGAVMVAAAVSVARPLNRVRAALRHIEQGDLDVHVPVDDLGELGRLAEGVNNLVAGIREREELRDLFGRQVGQAGLADLALTSGVGAIGERRCVTVLFVDLRGYTSFAERHHPEEVVEMLNHFFRVVVAVVNREGGWVNKFEGDAALCLFGAPQDQADHATRALRAAAGLPAELRRSGPTQLRAGIGVATGEVIAGFIGTAERFEYTVIGDVVNLASRLCDAAKDDPSGVLVDARTVADADGSVETEPAGRRSLRGRRERSETYRPATPRRRTWYGTPRSRRAERSAP
jgi:adenylate cyclase